MRRISFILSVFLLVSLFGGVPRGAAATSGSDALLVDESLHYEWKLEGFLGTIARLLFPGHGEGLIRAEGRSDGLIDTELHITSSSSDNGEFWLYGARVNPETGSTQEVWNSYRYRDKDKQKRAPVEESGVIDIASGIYLLRQNPPTASRPMKIWSDGKIYPVRVEPGEWRDRKLANGERVRARVYRIRGDKGGGDGVWKGRLDLWLAADELSTPVEVLVERASVRVRLRLLESPTPAGEASTEG